MKKLIFTIIGILYIIRIFYKNISISSKIGEIIGFTILLILIYLLIDKFRIIKKFFRKLRLKIAMATI